MNIQKIKLLFILVLLSLSLILDAAYIDCEIKHLKNKNGQLIISLFNSESTFLKKEYKKIILDVNATHMNYRFKDIPGGEYALFIIHDENSDQEGEIGLFFSQDGYGVSNNSSSLFAVDDFAKAKFLVEDAIDIRINMNY